MLFCKPYHIPAFVLLFWTASLTVACTKADSNPDNAKPVVESYLQPGRTASVKLTRQLPVNETDSSSYSITTATVKITYLGKEYELLHTADGVYVNTQLPIAENGVYSLSVSYNGIVTTATTTIPSKPKNVTQSATTLTPVFSSTPVEMMYVTWDNPGDDYYFVQVKPLDLSAPLTNANFSSSDRDALVEQTNKRTIYNRSFHYYGKHAILVYHVQSDYATLYNSTTTNSLNASGIPTAISNGYGIFTGVNMADSLFVTIQ